MNLRLACESAQASLSGSGVFRGLPFKDIRTHYVHGEIKKGQPKLANPSKLLARPRGFEPPTYGFVVP
jgi:hypothetical protein